MSSLRTASSNPARWVAAATGLTGAVSLTLLLLAEHVELPSVYMATSLFFVGSILFVKLSVRPSRWERTVNGPEARRFLAIGLGITCLMLLAGIVILVGWVYRSAG